MNLDPWKVSEIRETINNLAYMPMQVISEYCVDQQLTFH
jgi:hypothetical protein